MYQLAGIISVILLVSVALFQFAVALGLPQGDMVMGGRFPKVLPTNLRIATFITGVTLLLASILFAIKSGLILDSADSNLVNIGVVFFTVFLGLNTLGNIASKSNKERIIMTPVSLIIMICGLVMIFG